MDANQTVRAVMVRRMAAAERSLVRTPERLNQGRPLHARFAAYRALLHDVCEVVAIAPYLERAIPEEAHAVLPRLAGEAWAQIAPRLDAWGWLQALGAASAAVAASLALDGSVHRQSLVDVVAYAPEPWSIVAGPTMDEVWLALLAAEVPRPQGIPEAVVGGFPVVDPHDPTHSPRDVCLHTMGVLAGQRSDTMDPATLWRCAEILRLALYSGWLHRDPWVSVWMVLLFEGATAAVTGGVFEPRVVAPPWALESTMALRTA